MSELSEHPSDRRELLLLDELEAVKAAIERVGSAGSQSGVSTEWLSKLLKWRDDVEASLQRPPRRAA